MTSSTPGHADSPLSRSSTSGEKQDADASPGSLVGEEEALEGRDEP